jgi:hypothetical protein
MTNKSIGIIGLLIPFIFIISFTIFFTLINPTMFDPSNGIFLVGYYLPELEGLFWLRYFNYIGIGLLIIAFCFAILFKTDNSGTNKIGKILLLLSGLTWISFGVLEISDSDFDPIFLVLRIIITLSFGSFGFLLLGNDFNKISQSKIYKKILLTIGFLISFIGLFDFLMMSKTPNYFGYLNWLIYFIGFGIIGLGIIKGQRTTKYIKNRARF